MAEIVRKKMLVGLSRRPEWEGKLGSLMGEIVGTVKPELGEEELSRLGALPGTAADLIFAGVLRSVVLEFAGEACEVGVVYYPEEDEEEDLDLSLYRIVDWKDVDRISVRLVVNDLDLARALANTAVEGMCSGWLDVALEGEDAGAGEAWNRAGDSRPGGEESSDGEGKEED